MRIERSQSDFEDSGTGSDCSPSWSGVAAAAQVNLTAAPTTVTMPDGSAVPMWGYICGTA